MLGSRCPVYTVLCVLCCTAFISLFLTTQLHTKTCILCFMDQLKGIDSDVMYVLLMASSGVKSECKHPVIDLAAENLSTVNSHCLLGKLLSPLVVFAKGPFRSSDLPLFLLPFFSLQSLHIPLLTFIRTKVYMTLLSP